MFVMINDINIIIIMLSSLYFHKDSSVDVKTNRVSHFPHFYDDWGHWGGGGRSQCDGEQQTPQTDKIDLFQISVKFRPSSGSQY